jgi:hypothetical protein
MPLALRSGIGETGAMPLADAISTLAQQGRPVPWVLIAVLGGVVVGLIVLMSAVYRLKRSRTADDLAEALEINATDLEPIPDATKTLRARYSDLPGLNRMRGTVKAAYRADLDGRPLIVFHHNFTTMAGNTPVVIDHTVYACEAPDWPTVKIAPRRFFSRLAMKFGKASGLMLENDQFNRTFWVGTGDEPFAVTLLSPEMQAFLLQRPDLRWRIRDRELVLIYRGSLKPQRVGASIARLRRFWSLVPPELDAWAAQYGNAPAGATP